MTPDKAPMVLPVPIRKHRNIASANITGMTMKTVSAHVDYRHSDLHNHGFNLHETYLVMNDGSKVDLESIEDQGGTEYSGSPTDPSPDDTRTIWQHYELSEPIDPSVVAQIYVCGECVYGDTEPIQTMQQEELPEETIVGDTETEITE